MGRLRPGEEVAFLGPSGYSRARAVVTVSPAPGGALVAGTLRFGRLERFSVLLGSVWVVVVTLGLLVSVLTGGGLVRAVAPVLIAALGYASCWARARDRRRMRDYLTTLLVPGPVPPRR
jgi:hypothetical protein